MNDHCKYCKQPDALRVLGRLLCIDHWFEYCELGKIKFLRKYEKGFNAKYERKMMARELREFVEDYLSDGREPFEILAIANSSGWKGQKSMILEILKSFSGKLKKRFAEYKAK